MAYFLYCIMAESDVFKFGISANPVKRFQVIQNAHYTFLYLVFAAEFPDKEAAFQIEQHIFRKLSSQRLRAEWVRYDVNLLDLLSYLAKKALSIHFYDNGQMPLNEFVRLMTSVTKKGLTAANDSVKAVAGELDAREIRQAQRRNECLAQYLDIIGNTFYTRFDNPSVKTFVNQPTYNKRGKI